MRNISPTGEICCFLCSACNITYVVSTVKRWVLIILWRFCEALILRASQGFFTCFRTRFSWFDHIFTTNSWKNIFVWFSYHILRQRLMVYTTAGTISGRFILKCNTFKGLRHFFGPFCQVFFANLDFTGFTGIFHLLSHSIFLIWPHFYHKFLKK